LRTEQRKSGYETFGWQAVQLDMPPDWSLAALSGDRNSGYVSLDDERAIRLEIRWERMRKPTDWKALFEEYIRKASKKQKRPVDDYQAELIDLPPCAPYEIGAARWLEGNERHAMAGFRCPDCKRLTLVHVNGLRDRNPVRLLETFAKTFADHRADGTDLWSLYGLSWALPDSFVLGASSFKAGLMELSWRRRKEDLQLKRLALGGKTLAGRGLGEWAREFLGRRGRFCAWSTTELGVAGHSGVLLSGSPKLPARLTGARRGAVAAWLCDGTDRLFFVRLTGGREPAGRLDELLRRFACHKGLRDVSPQAETGQGRQPAGIAGV